METEMTPPFTKDELKNYVSERGYTADIDAWYLWYERNGFTYQYGKHLYPLKNWKADVNMKLRHKSFNAKKKIECKQKKPVNIEPILPATDEQKKEFRKQFEALVRHQKPDMYRNRGLSLTKARKDIKRLQKED